MKMSSKVTLITQNQNEFRLDATNYTCFCSRFIDAKAKGPMTIFSIYLLLLFARSLTYPCV